MTTLTVEIDPGSCAEVLVPTGTQAPPFSVLSMHVTGGTVQRILRETDLGLAAGLIRPDGPTVTVTYELAPFADSLPERAFAPRETPFTTAAADLVAASQDIAQAAGGGAAGIAALVAEAESRFSYAHPKVKFNAGMDQVPFLSCGLAEGSCVDINTYLVASLRAAGYEAAYFYGFFFPQERGGMTDDGHCWVTTRLDGALQHWDIAHHLKAGLGATRPALNPRPGQRVALTHSMGHRFPGIDNGAWFKIVGEAMGRTGEEPWSYLGLKAHLAPW